MTALVWGANGSRYYEVGVDRGALYLAGIPGVAWPGLVSVTENISGGDARPYYIDGFKYLNIQAAEEFGASIEAFSAPREFDVCDGRKALAPGLFATQQVRKQFGFSYRTRIGNDVDGSDTHYKIHIVYNALSSTPSITHKTLDASGAPSTITWDITTKAPMFSGARPTAHFVIDTRDVDSIIVRYLEDLLYGTRDSDPRLPSVDELIDIFRGVIPYNVLPEEEYYALFPATRESGTSVLGSTTPGVYSIPSYTNMTSVVNGLWELD